MRLLSPVIRLLAVLSLAILLSSAPSYTALAQDDGTPPAGEETPPPAEPTAEPDVLQGTLIVYVYTCPNGPEGVAVEVYLEGEFAPDASCLEEGTAAVSIDGGEAQAAGSGAEFLLDEGEHSVAEATVGASVTVAVSSQAATSVSIVLYTVVEEQGAPVVTGSILVTKHICPEDVQTQEQFDALGDFYAKSLACLVITLPGDAGPQGSLSGNDPVNQLSFDFEIGDGTTTQAIDAATFVPKQICEDDLGQDINNDPADNLCLDSSNYQYDGINQGLVTITEATPPDGFAFGALEFYPDSGDDETFPSTSVEEGTIDLDTAGDDSVALHIFNFQVPPENQIIVIKHKCKEIANLSDFEAIGDYYDKIQACPVITLNGQDGPDGAVDGGHGTFDFEVDDADGVTQTIADATFVSDQLCESDLGEDINGNPDDDVCLSSAYYRYNNVLQGEGVLVTETKGPTGYQYGAVEFDPATDDDAALVDASDDGVIELDTTDDGGVVLHIFNLKKLDVATPTPTRTPIPTPTRTATPAPTAVPSQYGSVTVIKFFCIADSEYTVMNVLAPGEQAGPEDWGDESCIAGQADFAITAFSSYELAVFFTNIDGQITISQVPVTDENTGPHVLKELYTEVSAEFDVDPGTVTRIIVLNYETGSTDEPKISAAVTSGTVIATAGAGVTAMNSGNDLPDTGIGQVGGSAAGTPVALIFVMGLLLFAGASRLGLRRRPF